eukprot:Tamp_31343.p1 GENE.Tamp_31343~~Tamp_31343.p1  ORF type:complete len:230 (-),score=37.67 Tamp_31343:13-606(-)
MRVLRVALAALTAGAVASPTADAAHHFFAATAAARPPPPGPPNEWYLSHVTAMDRSLRRLAGSSPLLPADPTVEDARRLALDTDRVLVAHGAQEDPIFEYGNSAGLDLWETDWDTFVTLPSRKSAGLDARAERERLLTNVRLSGFSDAYNGVRRSLTGKLFRIQDVTVWNVYKDGDPDQERIGQAATFLVRQVEPLD